MLRYDLTFIHMSLFVADLLIGLMSLAAEQNDIILPGPFVEAQKAQPIAQPTSEEIHTVLPWW